jgi:flavin reductase (DIM6/NTAB) family NADH-FMN oxidoreductase RutF
MENSFRIVRPAQALRRLSYGVYVVSARRVNGDGNAEINAMTVRMVSQVSIRPPCVALSILKRRHTHDFIHESGAFVVNVLAKGQELLGGHFGLRSGREINKFAGLEYSTGQIGAPILQESSAFLECCVIGEHDMSNCTLFIGEVLNSGTTERAPLVYREEDYFG